MDSFRRIVTASLAGLSLMLTLFVAPSARADQPAASTMKVAVIDVQRAVTQTEDGLRAQASLKKLFDSRQQELNRKQADLQKQKEDIDKQSKVISKEAFQKRMEDWQKQMMDLQQVLVEADKELQKRQKEATDPIVEKVMAIIKRLATRDGYDLIIDKQAAAFVRSDMDLTDQCIQLYNSGGAAAAPDGKK
jgi:outer membrane protein